MLDIKTDLNQIADLLNSSKVGVLPTDTLYGLVCRADDQMAVQRLYGLKQRDNKPGTIIAASTDQLAELGLKARYLKPVEHYWPGAVSIIIPNHELAFIHLGVGGIAVRIPNNQAVHNLLLKTGPLLTTSANSPSQPVATNIKQAQQYFGDLADFYVDGGDLSNRQPSTLIRVVDDMVEVLRQGAVKINEAGEIV